MEIDLPREPAPNMSHPVRLESYRSNVRSHDLRRSYCGIPTLPRVSNITPAPRKIIKHNRTLSLSDKLPRFNPRNQHLIDVADMMNSNEYARMDLRKYYRTEEDCCLFPDDQKSQAEKKLLNKDFSTIIDSDRAVDSQILRLLSESLMGVSTRFESYTYNNDILTEENLPAYQAEFDLWLCAFNEMITQTAAKSKSNAIVLREIYNSMRSLIKLFIIHVKKFFRRENDIRNMPPPPQPKIAPLERKINDLQNEISRLNKEIERLNEENKALHVKKFNYKAQAVEMQNSINELIDINSSLRQSVTDGEQKIHAMSKVSPVFKMKKGIGVVPTDVYQFWEEISQFIKTLYDGGLDSVNVDEYFPQEPCEEFTPPFFSLKPPVIEPVDDPRGVHFSTFFAKIKAFGNSLNLNSAFHDMETKLRDIFDKFALTSQKRFIDYTKHEKALVAKAHQELSNLRSNTPDSAKWISNMLQNGDMIAKTKDNIDLVITIRKIFEKSLEYMNSDNKAISVCDCIQKTIPEFAQLVPFISQIYKQARSDIHVDLFRKFIINELPFRDFLFYAEIWLKSDRITIVKKRCELLSKYFNHLGWNSYFQQGNEELYCVSSLTFPIFALSIYQHSIEKISQNISNISLSDYRNEIADIFLASQDEVYDKYDYICSIADNKCKPTSHELAILFFQAKKPFEKIIYDFNPETAELCLYMANFNKRKGKQHRKVVKSPRVRSQSVRMNRPDSGMLSFRVDASQTLD